MNTSHEQQYRLLWMFRNKKREKYTFNHDDYDKKTKELIEEENTHKY